MPKTNILMMEDKPEIDLTYHYAPKDMRDRIALGFVKVLRFFADTFFAKRYGHRAVVLETVAAVPGMVGGMLQHMRCLRRMCDDRGWITEHCSMRRKMNACIS